MENYKIHFIGKGVKEVRCKEDANYHLAAKYGVLAYNKAVKMGLIVFKDNYAKVSPFIIEDNSKDCYGYEFEVKPLLQH